MQSSWSTLERTCGSTHHAWPVDWRCAFRLRRWVARGLLGIALAAQLPACGSDDPAGPGGTTVQVDTDLAQFNSLAFVGGFETLDAGDVPGLPFNGVIIIRVTPTTAVVLDRTCTHDPPCQLGRFTGTVARCTCGTSEFDGTGFPVQGPALLPLLEYESRIDGSIIEFDV